MANSQSLKLGLLLIVLALSLAIPWSAARAESVHGVIVVVKGTVRVKPADGGKEKRARINMKVFPQDTIIAEQNSRAKIVMVDKNVLNISPETEVKIAQYEYNPGEDKKNVLLEVAKGKVRSTVEQKYDGANSFRVRTPTAVAGVRGTDFLAGFNVVTRASQIVTFEGLVEVGQMGPGGSIVNAVRVAPGQMTQSLENGPPSTPTEVPPAQFNQMNSETKADSPPSNQENASPDNRGEKKQDKKADQQQAENDQGSKENSAKSDDKKDGQDKKADSGKEGNRTARPGMPGPRAPASLGGNGESGGDSSGGPLGPPPSGEGSGLPPPGDGAGFLGGGSMLDPTDLATGDQMTEIPNTGGLTPLPPPPPIFDSTILPPPPTICEACQDYVNGSGRTRLLIRVIQGQ